MAMQQFNYALGPQPPREGDTRLEWIAEMDRRDTFMYMGGRWQLVAQQHRGRAYFNAQYMQQHGAQNARAQALHLRQQQLVIAQQQALANQQPQNNMMMNPYAQAVGGQMYWGVGEYPPGGFYTTGNAPAEAIKRAEDLLLSHLTEMQRSQYKAAGWFEVIGGDTGRTYLVKKEGWPGKNVTWMVDGKPRVSYCAYPRDHTLPIGDILLAQKMALESPGLETEFTQIACKTDHDNPAYIGYMRQPASGGRVSRDLRRQYSQST